MVIVYSGRFANEERASGGDRLGAVGARPLDRAASGARLSQSIKAKTLYFMGEDIQSVHLRRLQGRLGEIVYQLTRVQFSSFSAPACWSPALNAYLCSDQIVLCVDLAGVEKDGLELKVEARRLVLRGRREAPEPRTDSPAVQILAMEIDYGPFEREIGFPSDVETGRVRAEQQNGLLWVYLPLRAHS